MRKASGRGAGTAATERALRRVLFGLTEEETALYRLFCERAIETTNWDAIDTTEVHELARNRGLGHAEFRQQVHGLVQQSYLETPDAAGLQPQYAMTTLGFERYLQAYWPGYKSLVEDLRAYAGCHDTIEPAERLSVRLEQPELVIAHVTTAYLS